MCVEGKDIRLESLPNQINAFDHHKKVVVDFSLLVPILHLSEALLADYRQKKVLMHFLSFAVKTKIKLGKKNFVTWLSKSDFLYKDDLLKILRTTPLGNPAWWLFASSPHVTLELCNALDSLIQNTSDHDPRSLKTLIRNFIKQNPQYGSAENVSEYSGRPQEDILTEWEAQWTTLKDDRYVQNIMTGKWSQWNYLSDLTTKLMLLQSAAVPRAARQKIANRKGAEDFVAIEKDGLPIHRPDPVLYGIALRDLQIGTALVATEVWDEFVSLYMENHCTNFIAFAPLLLQPFVYSNLNIPVPNLTTLATLMGDFSGASGTFMGELTRANKIIRWKTLGLTIGKLCEKTGRVPDITAKDKDNPLLSSGLKITTRICGDVAFLTETPEIGEDRGWIVLGETLLEDRWDISLRDIKESLKSDKIKFNKFPIVRESLVLNTSWSLIRLDQWSRDQCRQRSACQLHGDSDEWFNKLPSTRDLAAISFSVFPSLTYTLRSETKEYSQTLKRELSGLASTAEMPNTVKRCGRSDCVGNLESNVLMSVEERQTFLSEGIGEATSDTRTLATSYKTPPQGIRTAAYSWEATSQQKASDKAKGNKLSSQNSSSHTISHRDSSPEQIDSVTTMAVTDTISISESGGGIFRFFIAEAYKEDRRKKEIVSRMRQRRLESLKAQVDKPRANDELVTMNDDTLKNTIINQLVKFKKSENSLSTNELTKVKGQLDILFADLIQRKLGITFPNLIGLKSERQVFEEKILKPHNFRYRLGDEEATAIEAWYTLSDESPPINATKAVRRVWVAMTYIWIAKYFTQEGIKWTMKDMWRCDQFNLLPLMAEDEQAVNSLIPYLYWLEVEHEPDIFRVKRPDMSTLLRCPAFRIGQQQYLDYVLDEQEQKDLLVARAQFALANQIGFNPEPEPEEEKEEDSFLPKPLRDVAISSLSLCSLTDWHPLTILEGVEKFFDLPYSPDLHPSVTKYHRLYVKLGVEQIDKRLSNTNLAAYAAYISPSLGKEAAPGETPHKMVKEIYATLKDQLQDWYTEYQKEFNSLWKRVGDTWISFIDDESGITKQIRRRPSACQL